MSDKEHLVHCILETACGCTQTLEATDGGDEIVIPMRYKLKGIDVGFDPLRSDCVTPPCRRFEFYKREGRETDEAIIEERYYREVLS